MQFRYLVFGLLIAAVVVGFQWLNSQPGIPPVRMPADAAQARAAEAEAQRLADAQRNANDPFRLPEDSLVGDGLEEGAEPIVLPALNDSDAWLREQLSGVALPWLAESELVRTAATVLENASRGELPRKFLGFLAPEGQFQVRKMGTLIQIDPASYDRYKPFVKALSQLPPERAAELFRSSEPLLSEALRELGGAQSPRELIYTALGVALDTPRVDASTALTQPKVIYTYADKALEELLPLQKQLLRMGPDNLQVIRIWLEDFGLALSPSAGASPVGTGLEDSGSNER